MTNPGQSIRLRSSARTSVGQVRENNEDNIHLWARDDFVLAVVADGMGGAAAGEEASRIAVETIQKGLALRELADDLLTDQLRRTIQEANNSIVEKAASAPEFRGMGTTVTLAFVRGSHAVFAHVGDSRAYLIDGDDGSINQITADHSFVEALRSAGHITQEQAEEHPMRNVLYRALGQAEDVDVDLYSENLHVGDRLVLCSDGLTRHVKPEEIAQIVLENDNPDVVSQNLINLANERGGEDNVSVIVILVEDNRPGAPQEKSAVISRETDVDEDDTLILRKNLVSRKSLPSLDLGRSDIQPPASQTLKGETNDQPDLPDETDSPGEDASDTSLLAPDPLDRAITTRRELYVRVCQKAALSPQLQEGEGEGHDTLMPEQ